MEQGHVIPNLKGCVYADTQLQSSQIAWECRVGKGRQLSSLSTLPLQTEGYLNSDQMFSRNVF